MNAIDQKLRRLVNRRSNSKSVEEALELNEDISDLWYAKVELGDHYDMLRDYNNLYSMESLLYFRHPAIDPVNEFVLKWHLFMGSLKNA